jgi:hypothetical protein
MACSLTPLIKVSKTTGLSNSSILCIFPLNLLNYDCVDSISCWVTLNSFVELFLVGMLVLKHATSLTHRLLNPSMEFGFKLLYHAYTDP